MQKGFATLEVIFATIIIAVLISVAIPNAAHVIDRVELDYETKKLYTDLKFVQSFDRMTNMKESHFNKNEEANIVSIEFISNIDNSKTSYTIKKRTTQTVYDNHPLPAGFIFSFDGTDDFSYIKFDDMGKPRAMNTPQNPNGKILDGHIRINSRFGKDSCIFFNTVGRFHGEPKK